MPEGNDDRTATGMFLPGPPPEWWSEVAVTKEKVRNLEAEQRYDREQRQRIWETIGQTNETVAQVAAVGANNSKAIEGITTAIKNGGERTGERLFQVVVVLLTAATSLGVGLMLWHLTMK